MSKTLGTYTADETAKYSRVHPYTVRRLARAGKIPGFKVGEQWRFDKEEIQKWSSNLSRGTAAFPPRADQPMAEKK